jgi:fatty acyl-CoA reductase
VEKLLRSCPDVDKVYILARAKNGKSVQERVDDLIKAPAFNKIRETRPNDLKKILAIEGDITKVNYGISEEDLQLLNENVGVVIHSAATISFDEPLRVATQINLMGTKEIMKMCGNMNKLEVERKKNCKKLFINFFCLTSSR